MEEAKDSSDLDLNAQFGNGPVLIHSLDSRDYIMDQVSKWKDKNKKENCYIVTDDTFLSAVTAVGGIFLNLRILRSQPDILRRSRFAVYRLNVTFQAARNVKRKNFLRTIFGMNASFDKFLLKVYTKFRQPS